MYLRWPVCLLAGSLLSPVAAAQAPAKADLAKAEQTVTQVCAACHAADGNSTLAVNPVLAGQHADYTQKQLMNFKSQGGKPAERSNPVMAGMVATLSTDDMRNLAAYFETQTRKPRAARDPALVKLGQAIYRGGILSKNRGGLYRLSRPEWRRRAGPVPATRGTVCRVHRRATEGIPLRRACQRSQSHDARGGRKTLRQGNRGGRGIYRRPALASAGRPTPAGQA